MRHSVLVSVVSVAFASVGLSAGVAPDQDRDVSKLLAAARQALGGEAALSAVTTFTATGSLTQDFAALGMPAVAIQRPPSNLGRAGRSGLPPDSDQTAPLASDINLQPTISYALEVSCALPDKFVRKMHDNNSTGPRGGTRTFRGSMALIRSSRPLCPNPPT